MGRFETILVDIDGRGVATITLNRPEKKNSLSAQMIADLTAVALDLPKNEKIRVAVLRGAGDTFCAGGDLGWITDAELDGEFATTIATMQPGQVSPPLRSLSGYHIYYLIDRRIPDVSAATANIQYRQMILPISPLAVGINSWAILFCVSPQNANNKVAQIINKWFLFII